MFDINNFSRKLSNLRKENDLTQSELADKLNVTRQCISRYENGESFPDISILVLLTREFNISIEELLCLETISEKNLVNRLVKSVKIDINEIETIEDLIRFAPVIKPSVLEDAVVQFKKQGINLDSIVKLVEYLNEKTIYSLLETVDYEYPSCEVLSILLPYMDDESKWIVFSKILEGKIDYHFLETFIPACKWIDTSLIEAAVMEGAIDKEALEVVRIGNIKRFKMLKESKIL